MKCLYISLTIKYDTKEEAEESIEYLRKKAGVVVQKFYQPTGENCWIVELFKDNT